MLELALLTLAALAEPQCRAHPWEVHAIVLEADRASRRYSLPVGLLVAVVMLESTGRAGLIVKRRCGYDVGAGQLHEHGTDIPRQRLQRLLVLSTNLDLAARHLARSRERCLTHPRWPVCRACTGGFYNAGAAKRWCRRLGRVYNRIINRATQRLEPLGALTPQRTLCRRDAVKLRRECIIQQDEARFWSYVDRQSGPVKPGEPSLCWTWSGYSDKDGYGLIEMKRLRRDGLSPRASDTWRAHLVAYAIANGSLPDGLLVCHSCDNPPCCNPAHLWLGTPLDNARDAMAKGRCASGDRNWSHLYPDRVRRGSDVNTSKLSAEQVVEIRKLFATGRSKRSLSIEFGVARPSITKIIERKYWRHIA